MRALARCSAVARGDDSLVYHGIVSSPAVQKVNREFSTHMEAPRAPEARAHPAHNLLPEKPPQELFSTEEYEALIAQLERVRNAAVEVPMLDRLKTELYAYKHKSKGAESLIQSLQTELSALGAGEADTERTYSKVEYNALRIRLDLCRDSARMALHEHGESYIAKQARRGKHAAGDDIKIVVAPKTELEAVVDPTLFCPATQSLDLIKSHFCPLDSFAKLPAERYVEELAEEMRAFKQQAKGAEMMVQSLRAELKRAKDRQQMDEAAIQRLQRRIESGAEVQDKPMIATHSTIRHWVLLFAVLLALLFFSAWASTPRWMADVQQPSWHVDPALGKATTASGATLVNGLPWQ